MKYGHKLVIHNRGHWQLSRPGELLDSFAKHAWNKHVMQHADMKLKYNRCLALWSLPSLYWHGNNGTPSVTELNFSKTMPLGYRPVHEAAPFLIMGHMNNKTDRSVHAYKSA
jgi:hypothetical protein